jgi:hypothetical protein
MNIFSYDIKYLWGNCCYWTKTKGYIFADNEEDAKNKLIKNYGHEIKELEIRSSNVVEVCSDCGEW